MDRKGLLIIVATICVIFGYQFFVAGPEQRKKQEEFQRKKTEYDAWKEAEAKKAAANAPAPAPGTPANPAAGTPASPAGTPGTPSVEPVTPPAAVARVMPITDDTQIVASEVGTVRYVFTPHGAGIARVILNEHFLDKEKRWNIVLNEFGTFPIGALGEQPGDVMSVNQKWEKFDVDEKARTVTFVREDKMRGLRITKKFSLPLAPNESDPRKVKLRSEYLVNMDVTYENLTQEPRLAPATYLHLGGTAPINQLESKMYQGFDFWRDGSNNSRTVDSFGAGSFLFWTTHAEQPIFREDKDLIRWSAVTNQYFTTMATMLGGEGKSGEEERPFLGTTAWAKRTQISPDDWRRPHLPWRPDGHELTKDHPLYQIDGAIGLKELTVSPGQPVTRSFQIYAGPREYRRLRLLEHHESDVLDYGSFLGIPTGPFSRGLLNMMNFLYTWVGSYALAIIILTILIKAVLWPLQNKANKSMKKMAEVQPQIKELQAKYKDDPAKFQQEMSKVWKKHGVNPLGGCWPIFIQVPIFMGFYNMLGKAVELRHHPFLWVKDLAAPDTIAVLPILGYHIAINPLPLIMAVSMFAQMKMAPQSGDPMQRKIFMFMPLIFLFMCYDFASALALYWTVQNIISIVQLLVNRNKTAAEAKLKLAK